MSQTLLHFPGLYLDEIEETGSPAEFGREFSNAHELNHAIVYKGLHHRTGEVIYSFNPEDLARLCILRIKLGCEWVTEENLA
jgi:hypothetical protein